MWSKNYVKYDGYDFAPVHIFLSVSGATGISYWMKVIYNTTSKTLLYHCKDSEKPRGF